MSKDISVTQAGSILSQEKSELPTAVVADDTYNLLAIEVGSSEPNGQGYITLVMVSDNGNRTAYAMPNEALPDVASLILGYIAAHQVSSGD
jgi:hypothetical protein